MGSGVKPLSALMIGVLVTGGQSAANAQLLEEQVIGSERVCVYRSDSVSPDPVSSDLENVNTRRLGVGLGEACPAQFPRQDKNLVAPPTARLASSRVLNGERVCRYEQRSRAWTVTVSLEKQCSMTAGMLDRQSDQRDAD